MYIKDIQEIVTSPLGAEIKTEEFIKTHRAVEGYLKRLLLIGLRLKGMKYKQAQKTISNTFLKNVDLSHKCVQLIDSAKSKTFWTAHADLKILRNLFLEFSSIYRNKVEHAVIAEIRDEQLLKLLMYVNISFLSAFEKVLKAEFDKSAFSPPTEWGARRSTKTFSETEIAQLRLGSQTRPPKNPDEVINQLNQTNCYKFDV